MGACTSDRHISTSITNKIHNQNHRVDIMKLEIIININNQNRTS